MLEHQRPVLAGDPDRTFVVGGRRKYLAISTAGAHYFIGQHPLWAEEGKTRTINPEHEQLSQT